MTTLKFNWTTPLLIVLLFLLIAGIGSLVFVVCFPDMTERLISNAEFATQIIFFLVILIINKFFLIDKKLLEIKVSFSKLSFVILLGCLLFVINYFILYLFGCSFDEPKKLDNYMLVINIISVCLIAPIVEEILFRGILFRNLSYRYSFLFSSIYSSFLFSFFHVALIQLTPTFIIGFTLCWVLNRENKIIYCIIAHMVINALNMLILY